MIQGSPIVENEATSLTSLESLISSVGQNNNFIMYSAESFEASSFVTRLSEVEEEEFYGIEMACDAIPIQQNICLNHPASCQSTKISIINLENTIEQRSHTLHSIKRVCEPKRGWPLVALLWPQQGSQQQSSLTGKSRGW